MDDIVLVFDELGTLVERLLHGPQVDQVLAGEDASGDVQWFLGDHLGTIRDVVEYDSGTDTTTVVNHLQYSSFGQITSQTSWTDETRPVEKGDRHAGSCLRLVMATAEAASQSPFSTSRDAFTGREWDADSDLYYYRARWYDPTAGRFISEDPIGFAAGDVNVSRYVRNVPQFACDPTGLTDLGTQIEIYLATPVANVAGTIGGMIEILAGGAEDGATLVAAAAAQDLNAELQQKAREVEDRLLEQSSPVALATIFAARVAGEAARKIAFVGSVGPVAKPLTVHLINVRAEAKRLADESKRRQAEWEELTGHSADGPTQPAVPTDYATPGGRDAESVINDPMPPGLRD